MLQVGNANGRLCKHRASRLGSQLWTSVPKPGFRFEPALGWQAIQRWQEDVTGCSDAGQARFGTLFCSKPGTELLFSETPEPRRVCLPRAGSLDDAPRANARHISEADALIILRRPSICKLCQAVGKSTELCSEASRNQQQLAVDGCWYAGRRGTELALLCWESSPSCPSKNP